MLAIARKLKKAFPSASANVKIPTSAASLLPYTDVERAQIVALHKNGLSQRQISKELGINRSPVQKAIKNSPQKEFMEVEKNGTPRKTTARDDTTMKRIVARSPSSCKKLCAHFLKKVTDISISNVSRRLSEEF